jgi:hypothetical protein
MLFPAAPPKLSLGTKVGVVTRLAVLAALALVNVVNPGHVLRKSA